jgi:DNA polymerase III epsilon subunit-like protein
MEYIILDNEWNTTFKKINGNYFNELIEIGAVKLDENLNEISRFSALIRSTFTKKLSSRFQRLTNISTEEMLKNGMTFQEAVKLYTDWAGNEAVTLTWSNSDLYVLLENFRLRTHKNKIPFIYKYIDLQKYTQNEMIAKGHSITSQISVANAALLLGIPIDGIGLHRALDDSLLCAEILKKVYAQKRLREYVVDTTAPDYYSRLTFKAYIIKDLSSPLINRKKLEFNCDKCGGEAMRLTPFAFKGQSFRAEFSCKSCGNKFLGRVSFKKYYDKVVVKRNTAPITTVIVKPQKEKT